MVGPQAGARRRIWSYLFLSLLLYTAVCCGKKPEGAWVISSDRIVVGEPVLLTGSVRISGLMDPRTCPVALVLDGKRMSISDRFVCEVSTPDETGSVRIGLNLFYNSRSKDFFFSRPGRYKLEVLDLADSVLVYSTVITVVPPAENHAPALEILKDISCLRILLSPEPSPDAVQSFRRILEEYSNSPWADLAKAGLGEALLRQTRRKKMTKDLAKYFEPAAKNPQTGLYQWRSKLRLAELETPQGIGGRTAALLSEIVVSGPPRSAKSASELLKKFKHLDGVGPSINAALPKGRGVGIPFSSRPSSKAKVPVISFNGCVAHSGHINGDLLSWNLGRRTVSAFSFFSSAVAALGQRVDPLAAASSDGIIKFRDNIHGLKYPSIHINIGTPLVLVTAPDSKRLAVSDGESKGELWDFAKGKPTSLLSGPLNCLSFSRDEKFLAGGSREGKCAIWNSASGKLLMEFNPGIGPVNCIAFTADSRSIAIGGGEPDGPGKISIWEVQHRRNRYVFSAHALPVTHLSVSEDGKLVSCGQDNAVRVWDIQKRVLLSTYTGFSFPVHSAILRRDGKFIVAGWQDKPVIVNWHEHDRLRSGTGQMMILPLEVDRRASLIFMGHIYGPANLFFSPNGDWAVTSARAANRDYQEIKVWNVKTGQLLYSREEPDWGLNALIAAQEGPVLVLVGKDYWIELRKLRTFELVDSFQVSHEGKFMIARFSPDGKLLATADSKDIIKIWSWSEKKLLHVMKVPERYLFSVAFSPDGRHLASSTLTSVQIWDVPTGKLLKNISDHKSDVFEIAYSPNGEILVSCSGDGTIKLRDPVSGIVKMTIDRGEQYDYFITFSPDGRFFASGGRNDGMVRFWDPETGRELLSWKAHKFSVLNVVFSPDLMTIGTCGAENTVKVWNLPKLHELYHAP